MREFFGRHLEVELFTSNVTLKQVDECDLLTSLCHFGKQELGKLSSLRLLRMATRMMANEFVIIRVKHQYRYCCV